MTVNKLAIRFSTYFGNNIKEARLNGKQTVHKLMGGAHSAILMGGAHFSPSRFRQEVQYRILTLLKCIVSTETVPMKRFILSIQPLELQLRETRDIYVILSGYPRELHQAEWKR